MLKTYLLKTQLSLAIGVLLGAASCGTGVDGVGDDSQLGADPRIETIESELTAFPNSTFYRVTHPDLRRCVYPLCGGYFTERVNQKTVTCSDGTAQPECRILEFDYAAL